MSEIPREIRFCTSHDGTRLAYGMFGHGAALVQAANCLTHLEFDSSGPLWRHWIAELSQNHRLLRYDERGTGLSDWEAAEISLDAWVADLEAVVEAAGFDQFPLVALSQGAAVAITYAARHPDRVTHLVLCNCASRGARARASTPREVEAIDLRLRHMELGWGTDEPWFQRAFCSTFLPDGTPEQHGWVEEMQRQTTSPANASRMVRACSMLDMTETAREIRCPTLVLHQRGDARIPFQEGGRLASLIPGARFVPLEGRNHVLLENDPAWATFVREVRAFLPRAAGASRATFPGLSDREGEVLELIARGLDNAAIASALCLAEKTVRNHINHIFSKLEVQTRSQAIVRARDAGLGRTASAAL